MHTTERATELVGLVRISWGARDVSIFMPTTGLEVTAGAFAVTMRGAFAYSSYWRRSNKSHSRSIGDDAKQILGASDFLSRAFGPRGAVGPSEKRAAPQNFCRPATQECAGAPLSGC
jgi:hypothetical protein